MPGRQTFAYAYQRGMAYLWTLSAVMLLGFATGKAIEVQHLHSQREKEAELLYVGEQYRQAIRSYYLASPGTERRYPARLEDLLLDERLLSVRRHIRQLYRDLITGSSDWGIMRNRDGSIQGVYSLSLLRPVRRAHFPGIFMDFERANTYQDWRFRWEPEMVP